ncbi:MAG: ROK family protein [Trueperaceae bacterium]
MGADSVLAVDVGGSKCAVALVIGADVVARRTVPTPASEGPAAVVEAVVAAGQALLAEAPRPPTLLGIASAGVVDAGHVRAMSPELLPGWTGYPLETSLSERFGVPATALNDAQAAAWGEARFGAGKGRTSVLFVTVSTGVGGGLVLGGRLWPGHTGLAGHVGHLRGYASGSVAGRGGPRPKLEALVSGTAMARRAAASGQRADARQVIAAADGGAPWAKRIVDEAVEALAQALGDVRALVDPEVVVVGGGVGLNPRFRRALEAAVATLPESLRVSLVAAELGADAGLVGAADWARERLGTP